MQSTTTTPKKLTLAQMAANQLTENKEKLLSMLNGNRDIYTLVKRVSSTGMSRHIQCFIVRDGKIVNITYWVSNILGYKINRDTGGLVVGGCGMDMGFHVVYSLSRSLFPDGFKLAEGEYGRNGDKSGVDTNGGYCLKQQWL
mgnify:CR=1 FL=1